MTKTIPYLIIMLSISIFLSCKDSDVAEVPPPISKQSSKDYLLAEKLFCEVGKIIEEGMYANGEFWKGVTYYLKNSNPLNADTLNIDFGSSTVLNGSIYKGEIEIIFTGKYTDSGTVIISSFPQNNPFHINNHQVLGDRKVTNLGENSSGNIELLIEIINGEIKAPIPGGSINWQTTRIREWVSGSNTPNLTDDKYLISGNGSGVDMSNNIFNTTISQPILLDLHCMSSESQCLTTSGQVNIIPEGLSTRVINYGDSICDCNFIVTIDENNYPIYLD
ncbi:MAG: hypothetical protein VX347_00405 [Bacteroidota bacterium]|nr:hypothetical protein [Bacteroidota bacterium]